VFKGSSARAAQQFKEKGYDKVYALKGGWEEWLENRYPVEPKQAQK